MLRLSIHYVNLQTDRLKNTSLLPCLPRLCSSCCFHSIPGIFPICLPHLLDDFIETIQDGPAVVGIWSFLLATNIQLQCPVNPMEKRTLVHEKVNIQFHLQHMFVSMFGIGRIMFEVTKFWFPKLLMQLSHQGYVTGPRTDRNREPVCGKMCYLIPKQRIQPQN